MQPEEWKMDARTKQDMERQMKELAASYVPEWHFGRENPDIGSTLAILFIGQMEENLRKWNQVLDKYRTEFVNMLDISPRPARPACAVVLLSLIQDTISGTALPKGTKLISGPDAAGKQFVFETSHNIYVTSSRLCYAFMTEKESGKVLPLLGGFQSPELIKPDALDENMQGALDVPYAANMSDVPDIQETGKEGGELTFSGLKPFTLFADPRPGIEKNAVLFYHASVLDVEDGSIYVRMAGGEKMIKAIQQGRFIFRYYTESGLQDVESVEMLPDGITLRLPGQKQNRKVTLDGRTYSLLALCAQEPVRESWGVERVSFSSAGEPRPASFVNNSTTDLDVESFDPFGASLSPFAGLYIGQTDYFAKPGAKISMSFHVSYQEHEVSLTLQQEKDSLKVIKRKPRMIWTDTAADAWAEEISIEYFNGIGWKRLDCDQEYRGIFSEGKQGIYHLTFRCPQDWKEISTGAYYGRCLRMQLLKSDNCYMRPCIHHYPHLSHLRIHYSYEDCYVPPERVKAVSGTRLFDYSRQVMEEKPLSLFVRPEYEEDALYLGFQRRMEEGPVSILFSLKEGAYFEGGHLLFEYSSPQGFKRLKVLDHTAGMSRSGIVLFMPPADMAARVLEGKRAYWIRLRYAGRDTENARISRPVVQNIEMNAVEVCNIETHPERDYYLNEVSAHMVFGLSEPDILDVEVWVNEKGRHTTAEIQKLKEQMPDRVRVEYDFMGELSSCYVKWKEADGFTGSGEKRIYVLDRMNRQLLFGDGVHTEIPRVLDDVAFKLVVRCCNGKEGNVEAGQIAGSPGNLVYIDEIRNPGRAFGGSDMESLSNVLERGADLISARKRLVSIKDYEQEIRRYSDNIDKVKCMLGVTADGKRKEGAVTFVLLLKDYASGSYSFHHTAGNLKKYLLKSCELTMAPENMSVVEPVFVSLSVEVWIRIMRMDDGFELQKKMKDVLEAYLDPVSGAAGTGWEIGILPKKAQILMELNSLKSRGVVHKLLVIATYADGQGRHEADLGELEISPYMVCRNGQHQIHLMMPD